MTGRSNTETLKNLIRSVSVDRPEIDLLLDLAREVKQKTA